MEFLTTKGIAAGIEKIILNAKEYIIIISPYVKVDKTYIDRLRDADRKGIFILIVFGKKEMRDFEKDKFRGFRNLEVFFLENLHAKCYMNESTAIITSMNLYGYSEEHNREMGIEILNDDNADLFKDILGETDSIKRAAERWTFSQDNGHKSFFSFDEESDRLADEWPDFGYCIRCGEKINFNPYYPLCDECYQVWSQFSNVEYQENYCHRCGREVWGSREPQVDYAHPLCTDCED